MKNVEQIDDDSTYKPWSLRSARSHEPYISLVNQSKKNCAVGKDICGLVELRLKSYFLKLINGPKTDTPGQTI